MLTFNLCIRTYMRQIKLFKWKLIKWKKSENRRKTSLSLESFISKVKYKKLLPALKITPLGQPIYPAKTKWMINRKISIIGYCNKLQYIEINSKQIAINIYRIHFGSNHINLRFNYATMKFVFCFLSRYFMPTKLKYLTWHKMLSFGKFFNPPPLSLLIYKLEYS